MHQVKTEVKLKINPIQHSFVHWYWAGNEPKPNILRNLREWVIRLSDSDFLPVLWVNDSVYNTMCAKSDPTNSSFKISKRLKKEAKTSSKSNALIWLRNKLGENTRCVEWGIKSRHQDDINATLRFKVLIVNIEDYLSSFMSRLTELSTQEKDHNISLVQYVLDWYRQINQGGQYALGKDIMINSGVILARMGGIYLDADIKPGIQPFFKNLEDLRQFITKNPELEKRFCQDGHPVMGAMIKSENIPCSKSKYFESDVGLQFCLNPCYRSLPSLDELTVRLNQGNNYLEVKGEKPYLLYAKDKIQADIDQWNQYKNKISQLEFSRFNRIIKQNSVFMTKKTRYGDVRVTTELGELITMYKSGKENVVRYLAEKMPSETSLEAHEYFHQVLCNSKTFGGAAVFFILRELSGKAETFPDKKISFMTPDLVQKDNSLYHKYLGFYADALQFKVEPFTVGVETSLYLKGWHKINEMSHAVVIIHRWWKRHYKDNSGFIIKLKRIQNWWRSLLTVPAVIPLQVAAVKIQRFWQRKYYGVVKSYTFKDVFRLHRLRWYTDKQILSAKSILDALIMVVDSRNLCKFNWFVNKFSDSIKSILHLQKKSQNVFHLCCADGNISMLERLYELNPITSLSCLFQQDKQQCTPFMYVCFYGHNKISSFILNKLMGSSISSEDKLSWVGKRNSMGSDAISLAKKNGHDKVCSSLKVFISVSQCKP
ncbi:MAG TPA: hypothetical protein QF353_04005 [Gammaproteobacteria bacterium]|nr:hypothetical protein [Gammaproteobacteria bacterium]